MYFLASLAADSVSVIIAFHPCFKLVERRNFDNRLCLKYTTPDAIGKVDSGLENKLSALSGLISSERIEGPTARFHCLAGLSRRRMLPGRSFRIVGAFRMESAR